MRNLIWMGCLVLASIALAWALPGCSSADPVDPGASAASGGGPEILAAHSDPSTIELNRDLKPIEVPRIVADVRDASSQITDVMLHFENVPLTVPMEKIGADTWQAVLSPKALQMMAVSGETESYEAEVVAKNAAGKVTTGSSPVLIAIQAPDQALPASI